MPISLVVEENCEIHSDGAPEALIQPFVACMHGQPFSIEHKEIELSTEAYDGDVAGRVLTAAKTPAQARRKVWTVTF